MRVATYARVSSPFSVQREEEKLRQRQEIDNQITPLKEYISNRKWIDAYTYIDYASGKNTRKRPEFNRMMADAFQAKFDLIVVWKIDRFARSIEDFVRNISELDRSGIRFISITQGIDTDKQSPSGRLLMNIIASFAEFERMLIVERINASIAQRKLAGEPIGRTKQTTHTDLIISMFKTGFSVRDIAHTVGVKRGVVERRLKENNITRASREVKPVEIGGFTDGDTADDLIYE